MCMIEKSKQHKAHMLFVQTQMVETLVILSTWIIMTRKELGFQAFFN